MSEPTETPATRLLAWLTDGDLRLLSVLTVSLFVLVWVLSFFSGIREPGRILSQIQGVAFIAVLYVMLALSLNLQWGYTGLLNLGVAGFMAIGVYTMALLSMPTSAAVPGLGLPLWIGIPGGVLVASLFGALVALPAIRLQADYLAIVTLAFSEIVRLVIRSQEAASFTIAGTRLGTGGTDSLALPTSPVKVLLYEDPSQPAAIAAASPTPLGDILFTAGEQIGASPAVMESLVYTVFLLVIAVAFFWLVSRIANSPFGRVLKAIREDELVASSLGKDTRLFKIKVFALGSGMMGLVSILWFLERGSVTPATFVPDLTFFVFVALILGGSGSNMGGVIGSLVFVVLLLESPRFIRRIIRESFDPPAPPETIFDALSGVDPLLGYFTSQESISALRFILLGIILVYLMQQRPDGLLGHRTEVASNVDLADRQQTEEES
ncbi:branched-chain amino acid ABC transporter permease [Halovenus sp. WSH3]|uniref:Branched-chain amino acid ABC transporter permease n=1 Tax=Halovenus carboxidivorans TaxID=2692199 RepID=A0A6B0T453_9EURY|nr:branched-chain amino acid ABC transporter permease [Halovenus carboxidivorans]MXR50062.1 branched-chain amino acid ABC transporter permease [Halovenus carboxidivorans]